MAKKKEKERKQEREKKFTPAPTQLGSNEMFIDRLIFISYSVIVPRRSRF